ncbi:MAG: 4Fe-4S binding protein [Candidatus Bathyarchaeia archaeon]
MNPLRAKFRPIRLIVQALSFASISGLLFRALSLEVGPFPVPLPILANPGRPSMVPGALEAMEALLSKAEAPLAALAVVFILGALIGRAFCGWVCPFGLLQDILRLLSKAKRRIAPRDHSFLSKLKYLILLASLLISASLALSYGFGWGGAYRAALGPLASGPFSAISPVGGKPQEILRGAFAAAADGRLGEWAMGLSRTALIGLALLAIAVYGGLKVPRLWCRYLCPTGALMALFGRVSFLGIGRRPARCDRCASCEAACPMQVPILSLPWQRFNHQDCISCLECSDACPHGAIGPRFS